MDPLAQLNDIHLPEQVHNWPIALGWWLLAVSIVMMIVYFVWRHVKQTKRNKIKKTALTMIAKEQQSAAELIKILKWACMHYFPRTDVANKHGEQFAMFLSSALPEQKQANFESTITPLLDTHYKKSVDKQAESLLKEKVTFWLQHALPPKVTTKTNERAS